MADKKTITLINSNSRDYAKREIDRAADGYVCIIQEPTRTIEQNAKLWGMLTDISKQVEWYGKRLSQSDWKHIFSASLKTLDVVPNLEGTGFVALGTSTSKMSKKEFSDLIELMTAFAAEHDVKFRTNRYEDND